LYLTIKETSTHVKLIVSSFRVFGSQAWATIPNENPKDIEKKRKPLIFFDYYDDLKKYMLFDYVSKYVLF